MDEVILHRVASLVEQLALRDLPRHAVEEAVDRARSYSQHYETGGRLDYLSTHGGGGADSWARALAEQLLAGTEV